MLARPAPRTPGLSGVVDVAYTTQMSYWPASYMGAELPMSAHYDPPARHMDSRQWWQLGKLNHQDGSFDHANGIGPDASHRAILPPQHTMGCIAMRFDSQLAPD